MNDKAMLHIHNGDSTAGTARNANIPGEHLAWREALVCGPTPGGLSENEFRDVRAKHLAGSYGMELGKCEADLLKQEQALARFADHEEVVLWFEHDLFCQVHLIYLLNWFAQRELGKTKLSLVSIADFQGVEDFRGLGQLTEAQLASLFPQRQEVKKARLELGVRSWKAYTSPNPRRLESFISENPPALPFLSAAFIKHLQRFPSVRNGLSRIEDLLLEIISAGRTAFKELFLEFGKREGLYGFGDAQVLLTLERLANSREPLLAISNDGGPPALDSDRTAKTTFQITGHGRAVLNGNQDFVRTSGIDLWLGGVHLHGDEASWRWDDQRNGLVEV